MRSRANTFLIAVLVVAALGLAVMGLLYRQGREAPETALAPGAATASPPPEGASPPSPATPSPEEATAYPGPRNPTPIPPRPTPTLDEAWMTLIPELTEEAAFTPTPTATPAPPTPTATSLPPLDPALDTMLYAVRREQGSELMRVQVDAEGRPVGPAQAFTPSEFQQSIVTVLGLYPSPSGRHVAVLYAYSDAVSTGLLDTYEWSIGRLIPQPDHQNNPTPWFFDWSPTGSLALARGAYNSWPEGEELWMIDISTREYTVLPDLGGSAPGTGGRTAFSPDGTAVAVALDRGLDEPNRIQGEVWIIPLNGEKPYRVAQDMGQHGPIHWVGWSPHGNTLGLAVQPDTYVSDATYARSELWVVPLDGGAPRTLGSISIDALAALSLEPLWSPDGTGITFVSCSSDADLSSWEECNSNLYHVDVKSGETMQLTTFEDTLVVAPRRAADSILTFAAKTRDENQFAAWRLSVDSNGRAAGEPTAIDEAMLTGGDQLTTPGLVWIPSGATPVEEEQ